MSDKMMAFEDSRSLCSVELKQERAVNTECDPEPEPEQSDNTQQLGPCFTMNLTLLPMKLYYLFYFGALASVSPFLPVFFRYMSLSARQTGVITGLRPFVSFVAKPFWGAVADTYRRHKVVMVALLIVFTALRFSVVFLPCPHPPIQERPCNLADCVNRFNMTAKNSSWCLANLCDLKYFLEKHTSDLLSHARCGNVTLQCCANVTLQCYASSYLFNHSCHSNMKMSNKTVNFKDILEASRSMCVLDCNLPNEPLLQWVVVEENCTGPGSEFIYNCSFLHTETFKPEKNSSLCMGNLQYVWANLTAISKFEDSTAEEIGTVATGVSEEVNNSSMFFLLLGIILASRFFHATNSMADAVVVKFLSKTGRGGEFGKQRLWGAVSWGTVSILAGLGIDKSAEFHKQNRFIIPFCGFLALNLITVICAWKLPAEILLEGHSRPKILRNLKIIATSYSTMTFLLAVLVFGVCHGMIAMYLFWFLQDLGGSHLLMGLSLTVSCLAEIPFMFFAGHLIRIFGNHGVLYLTFACYSIRLFSYSFLSNPWFVLAVEPLNGVTFGAFWAAATLYGEQISPPGMAATVIGLVNAAHFGLGYVIAGFGGGVLYSIHGARVTFRGIAVMVVVSGALFAVSQELPKCMVRCCSKFREGDADVMKNIGPDSYELQVMISQYKKTGEEQC